MDWMPQTIREGLFTILFISGPLVILAAVLGLIIGIIQAATQVQEQTLASAVKIIGLFIALIIFGFYMFQYLSKYTSDSLQRAFKLVPSLGSYVKPRNNFLSRKPESQTLEAPKPATELEELKLPKPGSGKMSENEINEPELAPLSQSQSGLDRLGKPPQQIKTENSNLKKQELTARQAVSSAPVQQPARQAVSSAPVQQPARQAQAVAPTQQPARQAVSSESAIPVRTTPRVEPERRSISDAVNRLKSNFKEPVGTP
ncbi:MAG: hypothetical protein RLZZ361_899 [Cyanobacteriota bacterium]